MYDPDILLTALLSFPQTKIIRDDILGEGGYAEKQLLSLTGSMRVSD